MAEKLTPAQAWALHAIATGQGYSPVYLGQAMMERPGVAEKRRGGNRNSPQGLGRIGGMMMSRLEKAGLVTLCSFTGHQWHPTRAKLTPAGRLALAAQGRSHGR